MKKIIQTPQQRANTLEALNVMWPGVDPAEVAPDLGRWRCGTTACFGGWCAVWPAFKDQGMSAGVDGTPMLNGEYDICADGVLFGDASIWCSRGQHDADINFEHTDHEAVTHRLQWLLDNSEVQS